MLWQSDFVAAFLSLLSQFLQFFFRFSHLFAIRQINAANVNEDVVFQYEKNAYARSRLYTGHILWRHRFIYYYTAQI